MDYRLGLMCGIDLPVPCLESTVHQPRLNEIALIGEQDFFTGVQCLCFYKNMFAQDKNVKLDTNNFQIFMTIMSDKSARDKKQATLQVLTLLFPQFKITVMPRSLIFTAKDTEPKYIDDTNFEELQAILRLIFCSKEQPEGAQTYNPGNARAKEIADKLMKGRQRVAELKGGESISIFSQYLSVLTVGLHIPLEDLTNLTMFQLYDLLERYQLKTAWDIDIRIRTSGFGSSSSKQPDNWMKNIH